MSTDSANVFDAALGLPDGDRASLAYQLLQSLKPHAVMSEDDPNFVDELERRVAAYERGDSVAADWDDVALRLRHALGEKNHS